jgi:subtilase family serine protease
LNATGSRRALVTVACAVMITVAAPLTSAAPAGATVPPSGSSSAATGSQGSQHRIQVLTAALRTMQRTFSKHRFDTPGPQDIFDYQIANLWKRDIDGFGTTVAVIEGWDDPGISKIVAGFDKTYGLPNPQITTVFPSGPLPRKCPPGMVKLGSYGSCDAWKGELELDVISAHLIAPYAKIVISATPADSEITDDAASQVAPPEMMRALQYISSRHLANAISISDGTGEVTYSHGQQEITAQDPGELAAAAAGIPVTVATGDCGVVQNLAVANNQCGNTSATPDTAAWDDSPWVTALGGSVPNLTPTGRKAGPDPLWHVGRFSEGAGFSSVFARPGYQNGVAGITGSRMRSVPDITMDAQDGTSQAAPLFAGVLALATQLNHANVGPVNPALYGILGPAGARAGIADVVKGNNSAPKVTGFTAGRGFDVASGWGTINASRFVPSLVAATRAENQESSARRQAAAGLSLIEHGIQLSPGVIPAGHAAYLLDQGFLPGHPVGLYIDNVLIRTLTASTSGYITDTISPSKLKLPAGNHVLQLRSMLFTATRTFTSG